MSSGVLVRPNGDAVAAGYGEDYLSLSAVAALAVGQKFEVLCEDHRHYRAEIKQWSANGRDVVLHFCHWSSAHDYRGPVDMLYIAPEGLYSGGQLTAQNTYRTASTDDKRRKRTPEKLADRPKDFLENTRYPDDYLSKPRLFSGRRRLDKEGGSASESDSGSLKCSRTASDASHPNPRMDLPRHALFSFLGEERSESPADTSRAQPSSPLGGRTATSASSKGSVDLDVVASQPNGGTQVSDDLTPRDSASASTVSIKREPVDGSTAGQPLPMWLQKTLEEMELRASSGKLRSLLAQSQVSLPASHESMDAYNAVKLLEARAVIDELLETILRHSKTRA